IISFRATGEGHLSSIVFRKGILDASNNLKMIPVDNHIDLPIIKKKREYNKSRFMKKMDEMNILKKYSFPIMNSLPDRFEYFDLKEAVRNILKSDIDESRRKALEEMTWLVDSYYDIQFNENS